MVIWDKQLSFRGGMDAYTRPSLLQESQYPVGQNIVLSALHEPQTRYGTTLLGANLGAQIDGMVYWDTPSVEQLIVAANGSLYRRGSTGSFTAISGYSYTAGNAVCMVQAKDGIYLATSGKNVFKLAYDGSAYTVTDLSTGDGNPPLATILLYHSGRLFASGIATEPDAIYASDLVNSDTSVSNAPDSGGWQWAKFQFRVGQGEGEKIIGMETLPQHWIAVRKENSVWLVQANPAVNSAAEWYVARQTGGVGGVAQRAGVIVGDDDWFLSHDGVRSMKRMAAAEGQWEVQAPISQALQPYIDRISWSYASTACAWRYRQFVLFAVPLDDASSPNYVFAFDARLGVVLGVWTGWTPSHGVVTRFGDVQRMVFGDNSGNVLEWLDYADTDEVTTWQDNGAAIETNITSRAFQHGDSQTQKIGRTWAVEFNTDDDRTVVVTPLVDGASLLPDTVQTSPTVNQLPVDLPFNLSRVGAYEVRGGFSAHERFRESQVQVVSSAGLLRVRSISVGVFLRPALKDDNS